VVVGIGQEGWMWGWSLDWVGSLAQEKEPSSRYAFPYTLYIYIFVLLI